MEAKRGMQSGVVCLAALMLVGCATQTPPVTQREAPQTIAEQQVAQERLASALPVVPVLKRKIALGRITNETNLGRSLLRDDFDDPLGKQVTDLLSKALTESGAYLVFERPDLGRLQAESQIAGTELNLIGVDALVIGSLTEFGRRTVGQRGFLSDSKRQVAFAKMDIRLADTSTGHIFFATSGAGEASIEAASVLGFGSTASYDGTLNDAAIRQAVSEVVNRLTVELSGRPWETYILRAEGSTVFIGGGSSQGIRPGMEFVVRTQGEQIRSQQTGANVTLPGRTVARLRVTETFGESELDQGSVTTVVQGSLDGHDPAELVVRHSEVAR